MKLIKNIFYIFTPLILGAIVSILINKSIDYEYLSLPPLAPPSWLFVVMWTIIYFLMGLSYYLYKTRGPIKDISKIYYSQLLLNIIWAPLFFILKFRFISTIVIISLTILVFIQLIMYFKYYRISFYLNILYFFWLIFASYLTLSIYLLN